MKDFLELAATIFLLLAVIVTLGAVPAIACGDCAYLTAAAARAGWGE